MVFAVFAFLLFAHQCVAHCDLPSYSSVSFSESTEPLCAAFYGDVLAADGVLYNQTKAWFYPKVDEFTVLELTQSADFYINDTEIHLEFGDKSTPRATYRGNGRIVTSFHAYILVENGIVLSINWDEDAHELCDAEEVLDRFCSTTESSCATIDCDFKVYVGWQGTDKDGKFLQTKGMLLSSFRRFSAAGVYQGVTEDATNTANDIANSVIGVIPDIIP